MIIPEPAENNFRVAIIADGDGVNAVCLERFVVVHGVDETEALANLERGLWWQAYLDIQAGTEPFSSLSPAPPTFEQVAINIVEDFSVDYSQDYEV